jgi:hypothetical protein
MNSNNATFAARTASALPAVVRDVVLVAVVPALIAVVVVVLLISPLTGAGST